MTAVPDPDVVPFEKPPPRRERLRASDADRQATVRRLQDGLACGQLTFEETAERMSAAWAARYQGDLGPLTADLPPAPAESRAPGWAEVLRLALAQLRVSLATTFPGGLRSARARLAIAVTFLALLFLVAVAGATAHALFEGGPGFGPGDWHPHGPFVGNH